MFIGVAGGTRTLQSGRGSVSVAMTDPSGTVAINQSNGVGGWFPLVYDGEAVLLDSSNTMRGVYSPCELQFVAIGTGVYLK